MLPRLPPAANSIDVTITVNERLRPYFTAWYQALKRPGDTPEKFAMRYLLKDVKQWWIDEAAAAHSAQIAAAIDAQRLDSEDAPTFESEIV